MPWKAAVLMINVWDVKNEQLMVTTLEEYVKGVVAAEMPVHFELEALKAQAVVARTYAYQRITVENVRVAEHPEAHLTNRLHHRPSLISADELKARWGFFEYPESISARLIKLQLKPQARLQCTRVNRFWLLIIQPAVAGRENSKHYWSEALPYLRSTADPYSSHSPYHHTTAEFSTADFLRLMNLSDLGKVRVLSAIPPAGSKPWRRVIKWFSGRDVRQRLGLLVPLWFTASVEAAGFIFRYGVTVTGCWDVPIWRRWYGPSRVGLQGHSSNTTHQGISLEKLY